MVSFADLYGASPDVVARAPGRVNLIGEHTDYNDGFVLPAAIPLHTEVALRRRSDTRVRAWTTAFPTADPVVFDLDVSARAGDWADYVRAIVNVMKERGIDSGVDLRIDSTVPLGSGLSSSAALLVATARALRQAFSLDVDDLEIELLARRAENEFVGAPVGIMDQMACSLADARSALLIDTRSLAYDRVPLPDAAALLVIDSGVRHSHASGDYRIRRDECRRAAEALGAATLRDMTASDLPRIALLPPPLDRRARHVVTENARVLAAAGALRRGELGRVGELFFESHASMRDDFEVSVPEIDALVDAARRVPGVYGARLTGGGFGGSIVALVVPGRERGAGESIIAGQNARFPAEARIVVPAA
jgi:galactokinase